MNEGQNAWEVHTARLIPHLEAAISRACDHGVPLDKAAFLGLTYFSSLLAGTCQSRTASKAAAKEIRDACAAVVEALSEIADEAEARTNAA
jgi:hypothetical protein